jgi:Zn ribbon nucleic-acid-binding protein
MRILRQGDIIRVGRAELFVMEMHIKLVEKGSRLMRGAECPICVENFKEGESTISCPRCGLVHHVNCWMEQKNCSRYGCGYPVQSAMMDALTVKVNFETSIGAMHPLVKQQKNCPAGNPRDQVPFQERQTLAYCPKCGQAYHVECWLVMQSCSQCGYAPQELIKELLTSSASIESGPI